MNNYHVPDPALRSEYNNEKTKNKKSSTKTHGFYYLELMFMREENTLTNKTIIMRSALRK